VFITHINSHGPESALFLRLALPTITLVPQNPAPAQNVVHNLGALFPFISLNLVAALQGAKVQSPGTSTATPPMSTPRTQLAPVSHRSHVVSEAAVSSFAKDAPAAPVSVPVVELAAASTATSARGRPQLGAAAPAEAAGVKPVTPRILSRLTPAPSTPPPAATAAAPSSAETSLATVSPTLEGKRLVTPLTAKFEAGFTMTEPPLLARPNAAPPSRQSWRSDPSPSLRSQVDQPTDYRAHMNCGCVTPPASHLV
jgi:hypothetical protein